jgi:hypothetical protein
MATSSLVRLMRPSEWRRIGIAGGNDRLDGLEPAVASNAATEPLLGVCRGVKSGESKSRLSRGVPEALLEMLLPVRFNRKAAGWLDEPLECVSSSESVCSVRRLDSNSSFAVRMASIQLFFSSRVSGRRASGF